MKKYKANTIPAFILIIFAFVFCCGCQKKEEVKIEKKKNLIRLSRLKEGKIDKEITFTGTLISKNEVSLISKIAGRVEAVYVEEGDKVSKGQLLIKLEDKEMMAQLEQAEAALQMAGAQTAQARSNYGLTTATTNTQVDFAKQGIDQASEVVEQAKYNFQNIKLDYGRTKNLYDRGAVSKQSLDKAKTSFNVAKSQVEAAQSRLRQARESYNLARANTNLQAVKRDSIAVAVAGAGQAGANIDYIETLLSYTRIRSPINGVVTWRNTEPGQLLAPGDKKSAILITDNSILHVEADVPESEVFGLREGEKGEIFVDSVSSKPFIGKIKTIIPSADPGSRTFRVKIAIPNKKGVLKNGMSATAKFGTAKMKGIVVPRHWLMQIEGEYYLSIVTPEKTLKRKKVEVDYISEENALISGKIKPDEEVITTGQEMLKDGDPVEVSGYDDEEKKSPRASAGKEKADEKSEPPPSIEPEEMKKKSDLQ
ncbi:MAG: efflux RND transporter periplasmic adaptor subunit [Candidatus Eremiobacteraeota bacterium]|nr:efflux RND transporter periplasmic adaptor subunit [Candidatus Eremiobacteraeota bacterium]